MDKRQEPTGASRNAKAIPKVEGPPNDFALGPSWRIPRVFLIHGVAYPWRFTRLGRKQDEMAWMEPFAEQLRVRYGCLVKTHYWNGTVQSVLSSVTREECFTAMNSFFGNDPEVRSDCVVFAKSGGGLVVDEVFKQHGKAFVQHPIGAEIRVATPIHTRKGVPAVFRERSLLISDTDRIYGSIRKILGPFRHGQEFLDVNQKVYRVGGMSHADFNTDRAILVNGQATRLFELYARLIASRRESNNQT